MQSQLRNQTMEESTDAIDYSVVILRLGGRLRSILRGRGRRGNGVWWRVGWAGTQRFLDAPLKNQCGANADAANQHNELGIEIVALHSGAGVVRKRGHENLVDRLFRCDGRLLHRRGGSAALAFRLLCFRGGGQTADLGRGRRGFGELQFARAMPCPATESVELTIIDENIRTLRDDYALRGELLLDANGAADGANA